jgi:hypothetical protein
MPRAETSRRSPATGLIEVARRRIVAAAVQQDQVAARAAVQRLIISSNGSAALGVEIGRSTISTPAHDQRP